MEATKFSVIFPSTASINKTSFPMRNLSFVHDCQKRTQYLQLKSKSHGYCYLSASPSFPVRCSKNQVADFQGLSLEDIRHSLILQEDCIIRNLLMRAKYSYNEDTYDADVFSMDGFNGSLLEFIVRETENLHAKVLLHPCAGSISINSKIWDAYFKNLLPGLVKRGNDGNCGSAAVQDTLCLQALSRRIHYGKFVAEAKFQESPSDYEAAIALQDREKLMKLLTYEAVEETVKKRVEIKARRYGLNVTIKPEEDEEKALYKVDPGLVVDLYSNFIMPLTKEVQVHYLLRRLD
ncbi:chorismate mutase 3, chloroplastic-like isoform X2 [Euphorbia lathyris]|uniref:chorismate mutase 3, chloroplastic-like isoform X2 n=1 Tax=Euphorbia lathyris TaxID=212925 RepID=UPI00331378A8